MTMLWDSTDEHICRAAMETQTERANLWTQSGTERVEEWRQFHGSIHITVSKTESRWESAA